MKATPIVAGCEEPQDEHFSAPSTPPTPVKAEKVEHSNAPNKSMQYVLMDEFDEGEVLTKQSEQQPYKCYFNVDEDEVNADPELEPTQLNLGREEEREGAVCGVCDKGDDDSVGPYVRWIQCDACHVWLHLRCVGLTRLGGCSVEM